MNVSGSLIHFSELYERLRLCDHPHRDLYDSLTLCDDSDHKFYESLRRCDAP